MKNITYPMARRSDPDTSHEAAKKHQPKLSKRRQQVLSLVRQHPGLTSGELAHKFFHTYDVPIRTAAETPHKRLPELESLGYVTRGDKRECGDSHYPAHTWWPQTEQRRLF